MFLEVTGDILDHHHRCIDHHPDADCESAQRHEVCRQALVPHQDESHEHAKGNCGGSNKRAAEVAHQQLSFDQRLNDCVYAVIDELGLIVVIDDLYTWRQCLIDLRNFFLDAFDHLLGVFVDALEDDSGNDFSLTVFRYRALTDLIADFHARNVADANRRAVARVEHDVSDVCDVFDQTQTANDVLLVTVLDKVGARVLIVVLNSFEKSFERDVVTHQRLLIDDYLILLDVTAKTETVSDAGHGSQLQLHDPILDRAQLLVALSVADDLVEIKLTRARGDWSHLRFESGRDAVFRRRQALEDLLAREIDVGVVSE